MFGMVVAKRVILMDWKSIVPPSFHKWLAEMVAALKLERIFLKLMPLKKIDKIWGPFLKYLSKS